MFVVNEDMSIYVTRGDIVYFNVSAGEDGNRHKFQVGDIVRIKVYGKKDASTVVLQKDFPVAEITEQVEIYLTEKETKIGDVISKPKDYWYEIELNPYDNPQTLVGYDEDGAKVFRLLPEGRDLTEEEPDIQPEDIPIVDEELDMTSLRPVQNQAIARKLANLEDWYERTHDAVAKLHVTPQMFGAIADGVSDDTEAIQAAIDSGYDVRFPVGVYGISEPLVVASEVSLCGSGSGSKIRCIGSADAMLVYNYGDTDPHVRKIEGLVFDGNGLARKGLNIVNACSLYISEVSVANCIEVGIDINSDALDSGSTYEVNLSNINVSNHMMLNSNYNGIGVWVRTSDCVLRNIVTKNMKTGIELTDGGNILNGIHCWVNNNLVFAGSSGIRNKAVANIFSDSYMDTVECGFWSDHDATVSRFIFKVASSMHGYFTASPYFVYSDGANIIANDCYMEHAADTKHKPRTHNTANVQLVNVRVSEPHYFANSIDSYPVRWEKTYRCNFGELGIDSGTYASVEKSIPGIEYDDVFRVELLGEPLPDGVIMNAYLKTNALALRFYNASDEYVLFSGKLILTIIRKNAETRLDYDVID